MCTEKATPSAKREVAADPLSACARSSWFFVCVCSTSRFVHRGKCASPRPYSRGGCFQDHLDQASQNVTVRPSSPLEKASSSNPVVRPLSSERLRETAALIKANRRGRFAESRLLLSGKFLLREKAACRDYTTFIRTFLSLSFLSLFLFL